MRYIDIQWRRESAEDPIRLISELDADGWEIRKLEFFRDGSASFAPGLSDDRTALGEARVPPLADINADPQFCATEITHAAFARLWSEHAA